MNSIVAIDSLFEKHDEPVVQMPVNNARPAPERGRIERQPWPHLGIKFVEDNVNRDYIGVETIDPGGIDQIGSWAASAPFPPASPLIRRKPPEEFEEMRAQNIWDFMPYDLAESR